MTMSDGGVQTPTDYADLDAKAHEDLSKQIPFKDAMGVALAAGVGYGFDAYAVNIYGLLLPSIMASLAIGTGGAGIIGSLFLIGYTIGTIGFGIAADRFGRKDTLGLSIVMYGVTTALGGIGTNVIWFTAMRFLTGVGGAGELAVGAPYTCEMFPTKFRAIGTGGIMFSLYSCGYIVAGLVALFIAPSLGWQWPFIFAVFPSILTFYFRRKLQESAHFVIEKAMDKVEATQALLASETAAARSGATQHAGAAGAAQEQGHATLATLLARTIKPAKHGAMHMFLLGVLLVVAIGILSVGLFIPALDIAIAAPLVLGGTTLILVTMALYSFLERGKEKPSYWKIPVVRKRIGIGWLLYTANAMGYWGITVFLTLFMVQKFGVSQADAIFYAIMFYVLQFFMAYIGTGLSELIGRRAAGILGGIIMIVVTILAANTNELSVFLIFGAIQIAMLGWLWGLGDTYMSELFPTSIRGGCFGLAVGGGRVMSIAAPFLVGIGITQFGVTLPYLASAGLWVLTIIGYFIGPETSQKPLEQIENEMIQEGLRSS